MTCNVDEGEVVVEYLKGKMGLWVGLPGFHSGREYPI